MVEVFCTSNPAGNRRDVLELEGDLCKDPRYLLCTKIATALLLLAPSNATHQLQATYNLPRGLSLYKIK
jgi:hypothetical protein